MFATTFFRTCRNRTLTNYIKVAVRSANKERLNPIKGRKKRTGCAILVPFLLLLCVRDTNRSYHITATLITDKLIGGNTHGKEKKSRA
jgi:hypothetical protein